MPLTQADLVALGLPVLLAGLIGEERQFRDKSGRFPRLLTLTGLVELEV